MYELLTAAWAGCCTNSSKDEETSELLTVRQGMKRFIQRLVRGRTVECIGPGGETVQALLTLSSDLDYLRLAVGDEESTIRVADIAQITPGTKVVGAQVPLDECCSTVILKSKDCLTFRFEDFEAREQFTENLQILRLSLNA